MLTGAIFLAVVLTVATAFGLFWQRRNGRVRAVEPGAVTLDADDIGAQLGPRATLIQFTTAFCAPCRATRRILDEIVGMVDGVTYVDVDAEANLDLVRRLD